MAGTQLTAAYGNDYWRLAELTQDAGVRCLIACIYAYMDAVVCTCRFETIAVVHRVDETVTMGGSAKRARKGTGKEICQEGTRTLKTTKVAPSSKGAPKVCVCVCVLAGADRLSCLFLSVCSFFGPFQSANGTL